MCGRVRKQEIIDMSTVTIIGAGMMGSALAFPARENGHEVRLVGTHLDEEIIASCEKTNRHPKFERDFPEGVRFYRIKDVDEAVRGASFVICGVSSFGVDWFGSEILPRIPASVPVLSVTKGLIGDEEGNLICYPEYWSRMLAAKGIKREISAIGGPCTSYELVFHDQSEVTFCGKDVETLNFMRETMRTDYYHISVSTDVTGVESAVALKNGYALGITLTVGINQRLHGENSVQHYNSQAAVFGQGVREMRRLIAFLGGGDDNIVLGAGDLYVTVYGGRTRLIGILLGRGFTFGECMEKLKGVTLESVVVATRVARAVKIQAEKGRLSLDDFPLLMHVDEIINGGKPVNIPWEKFVRDTV